jgi:hypothetical protein
MRESRLARRHRAKRYRQNTKQLRAAKPAVRFVSLQEPYISTVDGRQGGFQKQRLVIRDRFGRYVLL